MKKQRGIYLMQIDNWTKIGVATNYKARLSQMNVSSPYRIYGIAFHLVDNPLDVESRLHNKFDDKRGRGEWFTLGVKDIEWIIKFLKRIEIEKEVFDIYKDPAVDRIDLML